MIASSERGLRSRAWARVAACTARLTAAGLLACTLAYGQGANYEAPVQRLPVRAYGTDSATAFHGRNVVVQLAWDPSLGTLYDGISVWGPTAQGYVPVAQFERDAIASNQQSWAQQLIVEGGELVEGYPFFRGPGLGSVRVREFTADYNVIADEWIDAPFVDFGSFGGAIDLEGDTLAIGAQTYEPNGVAQLGSVFIYERTTAGWSLDQTIAPDTQLIREDRQWFGSVVRVSGDDLIVGARGRVHCYRRGSSGAYALQQVLESPYLGNINTRFGLSLDIEQDTLVVGDMLRTAADGYVQVFRRPSAANSWVLEETLTSPVPGYGSLGSLGNGFGSSVLLAGERLIVGAPDSEGVGLNRGTISEFRLGASGHFGPQEHRVYYVPPPVGFGLVGVGARLSLEGDLLASSANGSSTGVDGVQIYSLADEVQVCDGTPGSGLSAVRVQAHRVSAQAGPGASEFGLYVSQVPGASRILLAAGPAYDAQLPVQSFGAPGFCLQTPWRAIGAAFSGPSTEVAFAAPDSLSAIWPRMTAALGSLAVQPLVLAPGQVRAWGPAYLVELD